MRDKQYTDSLRDNGLYTWQGDKIGEIEDDQLRQDVLDCLNGRLMDEDEEQLIDEIDDADFDKKEVIKLIETIDQSDLDIEKTIDLIKDTKDQDLKDWLENDVVEDLDFIRTSLTDDLDDKNYDLVNDLIKKIEKKLKPYTREDYLKKAKADVVAGLLSHFFKEKWKNDKHFEEDDWLMLRNMTQQDNIKTTKKKSTKKK